MIQRDHRPLLDVPAPAEAPVTYVLDTAALRPRIEGRLVQLGKTARGASREAGLGDSTLRNIMEGKSTSPRLSTLVSLASVLDVSLEWFLEDAIQERVAISKTFFPTESRQSPLFSKALNMLRLLIPISASRDDEGSYKVGAEAYFDPNKLFWSDPENQYLFQIRNDEMWPVIRKDDYILLDASKPLKVGEDYLFSKTATGIQLIIGRLKSFSETEFEIEQFTPHRELSLDRSVWRSADRVISRAAFE